MRRASPLFALVAVFLLIAPLPVHAGVSMDKAHLPKKPFKIYDGHLSADEKRCLQYALKQWVYYDTAPLEGEGNRGNTGAAITQAGGDHNLDDTSDHHARSQRSLGGLERGAMKKAYGNTSPFTQGGDPTQPGGAGWFTDDEGAADLTIEPTDEVPGEEGATFGRCDFGVVSTTTPGTSVETLTKGKLENTAAVIWMRTKPTDKTVWCYPSDTNGDGFITNADAPCPENTTDYYMIIKHELAHYFSFSHTGTQFEHAENPPPFYETPASLCSRAMGPFDDRGICESQGSEFSAHRARAFFSSNRPGGFGGFDLWTLVWSDSLGSWGNAANCGPTVNSAFDEIDPYAAVGEGVLFFASNRPGGAGGYDLYFARRRAITVWDSVEALPAGINTASNETGPCEMPDKLFFASDRPGGLGGFDLYTAGIMDSSNLGYGAPSNMGSPVNSGANEVDPEVTEYSGDSLAVLHFASDSLSTTYDLYRSVESMSTWSPPANLVAPVNTPSNETDPSVGLGGLQLYCASDRPGGHGLWDCFSSRNLAPRPVVTFNSDVRATPGAEVRVELDVANRGYTPIQVQPQCFNTTGWPMQFSPIPFQLAPGAHRTYPVRMLVPPGTPVGTNSDVHLQVFPLFLATASAQGSPRPAEDHARVWVVSPSTTGLEGSLPRRLTVRANPNPHAGGTTIELGLPVAGHVKVELFDTMGRRLRTLANRRFIAGVHRLAWDGLIPGGAPAAAGVVWCRVTTAGGTVSTQLVRVP
jgi:hypothetical protein